MTNITEKKMTQRDYFTALRDHFADGTALPEAMSTEALVEFFDGRIAKLDAKNVKRSSADTKEKKESAARRQLVLSCVESAESPMTRDAIAEATGLTPGQVTSACTAFVKDGTFAKFEVKDGKAKHMAYAMAEIDREDIYGET